jgi:hypothetical protein
MPWVTIRTGIIAADGHEAVITEYLCDWPDGCANVAEQVQGVALDVAMAFAVCREHAAALQARASNSGAD